METLLKLKGTTEKVVERKEKENPEVVWERTGGLSTLK